MCYKQSWQDTHIPVNNNDFKSHATGLSLKTKQNQDPIKLKAVACKKQGSASNVICHNQETGSQ